MSPSRPDRDLRDVDAEGRVPSDDLRDQDPDDVLPDDPSVRDQIQQKIDELQTERKKAKSKRQATKKSQQLKRLRTLRASTLGGVASRVAGSLDAAGEISTDPTSDLTQRDEVADRARRAGEARAPVDARLEPMGDPRAIEAFATAGIGASDEQTADEPAYFGDMEGLVLGSATFDDDAGDLLAIDTDSDETEDWFSFDDDDDDSMGWF